MPDQKSESIRRFRSLPLLNHTGNSDLARELVRGVRGEVRFDDGYRALYATDASNYRQVPVGIVLPRDIDDVITTVSLCRSAGVPVVGRGGGTSLAGQGCNAAVVLDFSKHMNRIRSIDPDRRTAVVEPGVVLDDLRHSAESFGLTFGPDPATHNHCTLGGMIGNNSCGIHSMMAGCTADNVQELEVLTYDGSRVTAGYVDEAGLERLGSSSSGPRFRAIRDFRHRWAGSIRDGFPHIPRRVSGYNLPALNENGGLHLGRSLVGSESTLVTILSAEVRLVPSPPERALLVLGYPNIYQAAEHIMEIREAKPIGLEAIDEILVEDMKQKGLHPSGVKLLPDGKGWLLVEFGGTTRPEAEANAERLMDRLRRNGGTPGMKLFKDSGEEHTVWKVRESGLGATARVPGQPDTWEGWEDASVPPERLAHYLRAFSRLLDQHHFRAALYGHFGQGCVHTRIPFDLKHKDGIAEFRDFVQEAADLVVEHGGSLSGEHGDGQSRAELLPRMFGPELIRAFEEWKAIWDPENGMNPGKVVRPYRLDQNLRLAGTRQQDDRDTHFRFPEDRGRIGYAVERCVGVGECRRHDGGTMCPSYMVTHEEMHSTRGRAHLLFEMLRGDVLKPGWHNPAVRQSLDLCLSCKGCKGECPVNVDMATYKAEFLSHFYKNRIRPRAAYAFGLVSWWARIGSPVAPVINRIMGTRGLGTIVKWAANVAPERELPRFARTSFRSWWRRRQSRRVGGVAGSPVLLWVDTWNNYWQPEVLIAAVQVLEAAGFEVLVTRQPLCCGRPLYDYGMLDLARRWLHRILDRLGPILEADIPIVGLEPSCISVFRDELPNLLAGEPGVDRLSRRVVPLADFLQDRAPEWRPDLSTRSVLLHGHCHHKAILHFDREQDLLRQTGCRLNVPDSGCCGMAGAFGLERGEHYAVSVACGERVLAPAIRKQAGDALIVADGFSCREQIRQLTRRSPLHLAQVLAGAVGPVHDPA